MPGRDRRLLIARGLPLAVFLGALALYTSTLATDILFGDPGEYTFVPHILGVIHPPGYAFYTLLAKAWQTLVPIGTVAYRTHLLSAAAGALTVTLVYGAVRQLTPPAWRGLRAYLPALGAAVGLAAATDLWQHASHANAHIVTVMLAALGLFLLLRWWRLEQEGAPHATRYLYAFAFAAGVCLTHHALLAFSFPAWGVFILAVGGSPQGRALRLLRQPRRLLALIGLFALGMFAWLYFPLRSAAGDVPFGPADMHTLDGFLNLVLARGLTVNLFHFTLAEQPQRALVFLTLLGLQFNLLQIALAVVGLGALARRHWRVALLLGVFFAVNLAFIINTVQDVMAYLMVPFMGVAVMAGAGVVALIAWLDARPRLGASPVLLLLVALALLAPPLVGAANAWRDVNLNDYTAAADYVEDVYARFVGGDEGGGAVLLADWEHLTPLWHAIYVEGRPIPETDLRLVYVAAGIENPWVEHARANLGEGPVYVTGYRRALIEAGFRLRPVAARPGYGGLPPGDLYELLLPPPTDDETLSSAQLPSAQHGVGRAAGGVEVVGYDLPLARFAPGEIVPLVLHLRADDPPDAIVFPYVELGASAYNFTTDSHWLTPWWTPGEVIGERFDLRLPLDLAPGEYPLRLGLRDLIANADLPFEGGERTLALGTITVTGEPVAPAPPALLTNIGHRVGLAAAHIGLPVLGTPAPWVEPLVVRPGDWIDLTLTWRALAPVEESYTVFVHLIDAANRVWAQHDYTPLGGAFPTHLWVPKWLPGQTVWDPYRLIVPDDIPAGDYFIQVGMYGMTTIQRIPQFDAMGGLTGDRYILGPVRVVE